MRGLLLSLPALWLGAERAVAASPQESAQQKGAQQKGAQQRWIETTVPRMADAGAQLGHARRLKRQMADKEEGELAFWRKLTVEAYQAVRIFHAGARREGAEAAFRAGELLRAGGDEAGALEEFRCAAGEPQGGEFRARARLEIGHIHRRAGRWREALEAYLDVASDPGGSAERRDDAWLWVGSAWKALGRLEDARATWRRVTEQGCDPLARIAAFDELCLLLLEAGDLEGAAGELDRCLRALSARALEETEAGERVHNALLRMRAADELPRAIARRRAQSETQGTSRKS